MPTVLRRVDRARRLSATILRTVADELRHARIQAGLSQAQVAAAAGISRAELSRIERLAAPWITVETICRIAVVLGFAPSLRLYPDGPPLRDAGQLRVLESLHGEIHSSLDWGTEVTLASTGDQRAWDAVITGPDWRLPVECEMRMFDIQALERRIALKRRDDGDPHVLLLLPRTRANREALVAAGSRLRVLFPLDTRTVLAALRAGKHPGGSGIVLL